MNRKSSPRKVRQSKRPLGLLNAAALLVCSVSSLGFLGPFSWFLDLLSHFRLQYSICSMLVGLTFLFFGRQKKMSALCMVFASINLVPLHPLFIGGGPAASTQPYHNAMLLNVNTHSGDPGELILATDPDIIVLEEINMQWLESLAWLSQSHPHTLTEPRSDHFGIGLFSKFPLTEDEIAWIGDVPTIIATIGTQPEPLRLIATHPVPPISSHMSHRRNQHLQQLVSLVADDKPVMLLGDPHPGTVISRSYSTALDS